ncbi:MAG TPA: hypothetical protein PLY78_06895 [Methanospirillum sp.]|nr:hypothetical protein [Methanospirillum sp.]
MNRKTSIIFITLILTGCVILTGCTSTPPLGQSAPPSPTPTPEPTTIPPAPEKTPTAEPASEYSIFDGPVTQPPAELEVSVSARKDPVYNQITVVFDGGKGQQLLNSINVRVTTSDGIVTEQPLPPNRGAEIAFDGSKGVDRVQVAAYYKNGASYLILNQNVGQTRAGIITATPTVASAPVTSSNSLYDGPVTEPPKNLMVMVDVIKDPVYRVITATFRGGHGQSLVKTVQVHALLSDGSEVTKELANNIGSVAEIQGTSGNDKVQVVVFYKNGEQYKISEKVFGPRG